MKVEKTVQNLFKTQFHEPSCHHEKTELFHEKTRFSMKVGFAARCTLAMRV
jgi:hypothetical protein